MNRVMEVARADEVTGNPHTVALTAPERVHFVKVELLKAPFVLMAMIPKVNFCRKLKSL